MYMHTNSRRFQILFPAGFAPQVFSVGCVETMCCLSSTSRFEQRGLLGKTAPRMLVQLARSSRILGTYLLNGMSTYLLNFAEASKNIPKLNRPINESTILPTT